ncbi:MAG: response regulator transcription factor [Syntrophobacteraceae bacterium]|nr:response regulator transcription factor [Syntrophobacteraceae bacterium]
MEPYHIVLADDHAMVRHGIKRIIEETQNLKIIGEASDGLELLNVLKKVQPHMVILDISMPNLRGLEATREIKCLYPDMRVLILSMHKNDGYLKHALAAGCDGYLLKEDADEQLFSAIEEIRSGKVYISPLFSSEPMEMEQEKTRKPHRCLEDCGQITARERQVLQLVAEGKANKEIAELLFLSVRTVEHHRANIMRKLNFRRTTDLLQYAIKEGYVVYDLYNES